MTTTRDYIVTKDVAKLIREQLARHFPGVAFSVRTQSYSGGSHVNVGWTDGPSTVQVDARIGRYCGTTFDGMDDSTHHHQTEHDGRMVSFGGSRPSTHRDVSNFDTWKRLALEMIRARCGGLEGVYPHERFGNDWVENLATGMVYACDFREETNPLERAFRIVVMREEN